MFSLVFSKPTKSELLGSGFAREWYRPSLSEGCVERALAVNFHPWYQEEQLL